MSELRLLPDVRTTRVPCLAVDPADVDSMAGDLPASDERDVHHPKYRVLGHLVNTLALIGGLFALIVGLIAWAFKLGGDRREERIHRYLAERQAKQSENAVRAHEKAEREGRRKWL